MWKQTQFDQIRHSFLVSWSHILSEQHLGRNRNNRVGGLQTLGLQLGPSVPLPRRLEPELPSVLWIDDPSHAAPRRVELAAAAHIETQKQHAVSIIFLAPLFSFLIYQHHNLPFLVPLAIGCPLFALDIGPLLILHTIRSQRDNQTSGVQVQNVKHQATPIRGLVVGVIVGLLTYCMLSINFKSLMKIN